MHVSIKCGPLSQHPSLVKNMSPLVSVDINIEQLPRQSLAAFRGEMLEENGNKRKDRLTEINAVSA